MPAQTKVARRYARAIWEWSGGRTTRAQVLADFKALRILLDSSHDLKTFVGNYILSGALRKSTLQVLFADRLHPDTWHAIRFVESKKRLGILPDLCANLEWLDEISRRVLRGHVTSAYILDQPTSGLVHQWVAARHPGFSVDLAWAANPDYLGGIRIQVEDRVWNGMVDQQLQNLNRKMVREPVRQEG